MQLQCFKVSRLELEVSGVGLRVEGLVAQEDAT